MMIFAINPARISSATIPNPPDKRLSSQRMGKGLTISRQRKARKPPITTGKCHWSCLSIVGEFVKKTARYKLIIKISPAKAQRRQERLQKLSAFAGIYKLFVCVGAYPVKSVILTFQRGG